MTDGGQSINNYHPMRNFYWSHVLWEFDKICFVTGVVRTNIMYHCTLSEIPACTVWERFIKKTRLNIFQHIPQHTTNNINFKSFLTEHSYFETVRIKVKHYNLMFCSYFDKTKYVKWASVVQIIPQKNNNKKFGLTSDMASKFNSNIQIIQW